jgi:hypothetical protein
MALNEPRFTHFRPIGDLSPKALAPNFTHGVDVFNPLKNIAGLEQLAIQTGVQAVKGQILKNTMQFFQTPASPSRPNPIFTTLTGPTRTQPLAQIGTSMLGMPVYSNLIIKAGSYRDNAGNVIAEYPDIRIDAVIMEVVTENNLITTDIQGRTGTVIEYVSARSPVINIKGRIMTDLPGAFPYDDVQNLIIALNTNKSLKIDSWFLNMFGIYSIMPKKKPFPQEEGGQEYQKFEFDAIADMPVVLRIKK